MRKKKHPRCHRGHPLSGQNLYRKRGHRYCRACRRQRRQQDRVASRVRAKAADELLLEREIAWLIDLPNIIDDAERIAR